MVNTFSFIVSLACRAVRAHSLCPLLPAVWHRKYAGPCFPYDRGILIPCPLLSMASFPFLYGDHRTDASFAFIRYGSPLHTFGRKVIAQGVSQTTSVELHPINFLLYFCRSYNPPKPQTHELSKTATLKTLEETLIRPFLREARFDTHPFRVWRVDLTSVDEDDGPGENEGYFPVQVTKHNPTPLFASSYSPFDPRTTTLEEALVGHGDRIVIECQFGSGWNVTVPWPTAGRSGAVSPEPRSAQGPPGISRETSTQAPLFGPSAPDFFSSLEASQSKSSEASRITPGFSRNEQKRPNGNTFSGIGTSMVRAKSYPPKVRGTTGLNNL